MALHFTFFAFVVGSFVSAMCACSSLVLQTLSPISLCMPHFSVLMVGCSEIFLTHTYVHSRAWLLKLFVTSAYIHGYSPLLVLSLPRARVVVVAIKGFGFYHGVYSAQLLLACMDLHFTFLAFVLGSFGSSTCACTCVVDQTLLSRNPCMPNLSVDIVCVHVRGV